MCTGITNGMHSGFANCVVPPPRMSATRFLVDIPVNAVRNGILLLYELAVLEKPCTVHKDVPDLLGFDAKPIGEVVQVNLIGLAIVKFSHLCLGFR